MFELLGGQPAVHHVVMKSIEQLDVHVAHQRIQDFLQRGQNIVSSVWRSSEGFFSHPVPIHLYCFQHH